MAIGVVVCASPAWALTDASQQPIKRIVAKNPVRRKSVVDGTALKFHLLEPCRELVGHPQDPFRIMVCQIVLFQRIAAEVEKLGRWRRVG